MQTLASWSMFGNRTQGLGVHGGREGLTVVNAKVRIIVVFMFTTYADDATIRKLCARRTKTSKAPHWACQIIFFYVAKDCSSSPRRESSWTNLEHPEWVVHDRWIGRSACFGVLVSDILCAGDLKQVACILLTVTHKQVSEGYLRGEHEVEGFGDGAFKAVCVVL